MELINKKNQKIDSFLKAYLEELKLASRDESYTTPESVLYLPNDKELFKQIEDLADANREVREVMVVGIGGSSLGARAVYSALKPNKARLSFFGAIDAEKLKSARERIKEAGANKKSILINIISKSGATTETMANAKILIDALKKNIGDGWTENVVVTTEPKSKLDEWAEKNNVARLPVYKNTTGRFSVFSPVGLFPLLLSGVDIKKMRKGASKMNDQCASEAPQDNPALSSALEIFNALENKIYTHNLFVYNFCFCSLGAWYQQLMAESLGKDGKGILPITSLGTEDLHSMYQLFLGGPRNIFTSFVRVKNGSDIKISSIDEVLDNIVPAINKKKANDINNAIYNAVKKSYEARNLPFCEIVLDELSEEEIGRFLQFKMIEIMLIARLLGVNAFDQPNVEEYKKITQKILS